MTVPTNIAEPKCWICGAPADSAEHRIKKSDLVRAYGRGPYRGDNAPAHGRDGVLRLIQGPNAEAVKYSPSLCYTCNTTRTQPYDYAYDRFATWLLANESAVVTKRLIDFAAVYGTAWEEGQSNLYKYFVKSFGCRLIDAGEVVPRDLVNLLPLKNFKTALRLSFSVNEDVLLMAASDRATFLGKGDLYFWTTKSDPTVRNGYQWHESMSCFTVFYWYHQAPEGGLGSTWVADAQHVYLGSYAPLEPAQRSKLAPQRELKT